MTNAEAIEILDKCHHGYIQENINCAFNMAKQALREKAEKERRYVVMGLPGVDKPFIVQDKQMDDGRSSWVATDIPTREAAQAIADIYEGVKP